MSESPSNKPATDPLFCHSQRPLENDKRFFCSHPRVRTNGNRVWRAICEQCSERSRPRPDQVLTYPEGHRVNRGRVQLVVAKYKENLEWLERFAGFDIRIYDKGNPTADFPLPNIGREAHTYLHHIIEHYDGLADTTVFLQGDPHLHCRHLDYRLFGIHQKTDYEPLSEVLIIERADGMPMHPGLRTDRLWNRLFSQPAPRYFVTNSAACFAVSRDRIHARPRDFYRQMMAAVLEEPEGAWQAERLWPHVFASESRSAGVLTASDSNLFEDLQFLLRSLQQTNDRPIVVFDLGLTRAQAEWVQSQANTTRLPLPAFGEPLNRARGLHWWQTWIKPLMILSAPFDNVLWLDADCVVTQDLSDVLNAIGSGPLLIRDVIDVETENDPNLAELLGEAAERPASSHTINAGVVGVNRKRDFELLSAWAYGVDWITRNPRHRNLAAWADQGILLWAVRRLGLSHLIRDSVDWNQPAGSQESLVHDCLREGRSLVSELRRRFPDASIVHWYGENKLSRQLRAQIESVMFDGPLSFGNSLRVP